MRRLLTVLATVIVGIGGCSMFGEDEDRVLMPLAVGNSWTYLVTERTVPTATRTYRIVDLVRERSTSFAEIEIHDVPIDGGDEVTTTIFASNDVGLVFYRQPHLGGEVIDYFRYPVKRNDRYFSPNGDQMCTSTAEDIEVPAGTFDVIIYGPCKNYDRNRTMFVLDTGISFSGDYEGGRAFHLSSFDLQ